MTESKRKLILAIALGAAVIWGYANEPWKSKSAPEPPSPAAQSLVAPGDGAPLAASQRIARSPVSTVELAALRNRQWGADPFFHPGARPKRKSPAKPASTSYRLKAILYNDTAPSAYLNNQAVRVGDTIDGATVLKIERRSVTLKRGDETFSIRVKRG